MNSSRRLSLRIRQSALLALAAFALACQDTPRTQVVLGVATDLDAPTPLESVDLLIERFFPAQNAYLAVNQDVVREWGISGRPDLPYELPNSYGAYAGSTSSPKIRVTVQGYDMGKQALVRRQATFHLVPERTIFMRLAVTSRCWENADCPVHLTCIEGRCRSPDIADSAALPDYDGATQSELQFTCDSGTAFLNTGSKANLVMPGRQCPNPDDVCIEGTCYRGAVFGGNVTQSVPLEVRAQISDPTGAPIGNAMVRLDDGPISLLRELRSGSQNPVPGRPSPMGEAVPTTEGLYRIQTTSDALTQDLRLTVTAPGFAPQVVSIPFKAGVARYLVPVVMFPLMEQQLLAGGAATLPVAGGGRNATIQIGPVPADGFLRFALIDGRHRPGQAVRSDTGELLQSAAILYLEHVGQGVLPPATQVTLGTSSTAPLTGATGRPSVFRLDLQGAWQPRTEAQSENPAEVDVLRPGASGFWSIANHTTQAGCIRGRVVQASGTACPGVQLRLFGPDGVSSFDSTGIDGGFCALGAQQDAALATVGNTSRLVYVPAAATGASCGTPETCADVGTIVVSEPADCLNPTPTVVGRAQAGEACQRDTDCAPLASCQQGFCTPEGYARITAGWSVTSDFDLHVALPDGQELHQGNREIEGVGRLSFEQCAQACEGPRHAESVVLTGKAPPGPYRVWVENFSSAAAGNADIAVVLAGQPVPAATQTVPVGAEPDPNAAAPRSAEVTFQLPPVSAR